MVSTIPAGSRLLAEDLAEWETQIDSNTAPGWTSYTPTWTNTSTQPALGNGSWAGSAWRRAANSDIVHFRIKLVWGNTTTGGTGSFWQFGFPTGSGAPSTTEAGDIVGNALLFDTSAIGRFFYNYFGFSSTTLILSSDAGNLAVHNGPFTWATGDYLKLRGWYQP